MATLSSIDLLSPLEVAKRQGSKEIQKIVEALAVTNELLLDAPILEASDGVVQNTVVRSTQPSGTRRMYNEGITPHTSQTKMVQDYIEMLEDYSDVDKNVADHAPDKKALLESEDTAFLNGLGLSQADDILYGNRSADPAVINGLHIRYSNLAAGQVIAPVAPGTNGNSTSIWMVKWAPDKAHLFYPRGRSADLGIKREFRGLVDAVKGSGILPSYRTFFSSHFGLAIKDPRAVKRISNIKVDGSADGADLAAKLIWLRAFLPPGPGTVVIYASPVIKAALDVYAMQKTNMAYTKEDPWGRDITDFQGMRIRQVDRILSTENLLT